jgi:competence protein ComEC
MRVRAGRLHEARGARLLESEQEWRGERPFGAGRASLMAQALAAAARALEREQDRWFLWLPVLFAGGIVAYFALDHEPGARVTVALILAAIGIFFTFRHAALGLAIGGACLAFAGGFAIAKLRTELMRAPVRVQELRYVPLAGWIGDHELREKGRARITLRVISLGALAPDERPYRVRVTLPAKDAARPARR